MPCLGFTSFADDRQNGRRYEFSRTKLCSKILNSKLGPQSYWISNVKPTSPRVLSLPWQKFLPKFNVELCHGLNLSLENPLCRIEFHPIILLRNLRSRNETNAHFQIDRSRQRREFHHQGIFQSAHAAVLSSLFKCFLKFRKISIIQDLRKCCSTEF